MAGGFFCAEAKRPRGGAAGARGAHKGGDLWPPPLVWLAGGRRLPAAKRRRPPRQPGEFPFLAGLFHYAMDGIHSQMEKTPWASVARGALGSQLL